MKRTKKHNECANPLFEKWLEEWKQEAVSRQSPMQHCFSKALNSLRMFPLRLETGKDCQILQNFGYKLCSMLDKKLEENKKLNYISSTSAQSTFPIINILEKRQKVQEQLPNDNSNQLHNLKKSKATNKLYVPKIGSGAYAILICLYKNHKNVDNPDFMLKKDIIAEAKKYCDAPMKATVLEHYTGWSSMSTLIEKQLVIKKNSPAKYSLTDSGLALALSLSDEKYKNDSNSSDGSESCILKNSGLSQNLPRSSLSKSKNIESEFKSLPSEIIKDVNEKNVKAGDDILDLTQDNLLDDLSWVQKSLNNVKTDEPKIQEKNFEEPLCLNKSLRLADSILHNATTSSESYKSNNNSIITIDDDDDEVLQYNEISNNINLDKTDRSFNKFCKENVEPIINVKKTENHLIFTESTDIFNVSIKKSDNEVSQKKVKKIHPRNRELKDESNELEKGTIKTTKDLNTINQKEKVIPDKDFSNKSFFLLPNNFDIILLVDTQETSGSKTKPNDDETVSELSKNGINFEIRSLKVGDFTWIARCRLTNKELVLPHIIERKRIDDLASSIKDGRYHEQKFRLRQSGIKNIIYMVENYGKNYCTMPLTSLLQASVNSLIQDNFIVKHTNDHKDSMRYLATLTKMLIKIYEGKELINCKKNDLELNWNNSEGTERLMEFNEFNKAAVKRKNFKVRELLIRQLIQLKGLSLEKALAITEFYSTPKILVESLRNANDKLLANIEVGLTKRKLGPLISKTLYQLYTMHNFS